MNIENKHITNQIASCKKTPTGHIAGTLQGIYKNENELRAIYLIILLLAEINLLGQAIEKSEYIDITKTVLSNSDIRDNLIEYSDFEFHPIFDKNQVFILDTNFINEELIVNDNYPKFVITDLFDIRIGSVNYWLTPTEIIRKGYKIHYHFKTQSEHRQDSTDYIQGIVKLKKVDGIWIINAVSIKPYEYATQKELEWYEEYMECYEMINCNSNNNRPKKSNTNNIFFGDWQLLYDSIYLEEFFTDDSIFQYNELIGRSDFLNKRYEIIDDLFIVYYESIDSIVRKFEIIDKNKIRIYGKYTIVDYADTLLINDDFVLKRIKKKEFKYSDVKCWRKQSENYPCFLYSHDYGKYHNKFFKRMDKYKKEEWNNNKNAL